MEAKMSDLRSVSRLLIWFCVMSLCGGAWVAVAYADVPAVDTLRTNRIPGVRPYPQDDLSGSMPLHALEAILQVLKVPCRYADLVPVSGALFKFVYDSTEAYEPLRDACPYDLLRTAANRNGFPNAHWETGLSSDEAEMLIRDEIDSGRPLISSFLKPEAYRGFDIITGYDYDKGVLLIKGGFQRIRAVTVPMPASWDGPTVSPAGWATNPLFVLGDQVQDTTHLKDVYIAMLHEGINLLQGGRLEYGSHEGEQRYMGSPGPHEAWYGLPAYDVLAADVQQRPLIIDRGAGPELDFGLVWRIDVMAGLLEHDRMYGDEFVARLKGLVSEPQTWTLSELLSNFERTTADAAYLHDAFWREVPDSLSEPDQVLAYVDTCKAIVFKIPEVEGLAESLRGQGQSVFETPWGHALVEGSGGRRLEAKLKVIGIKSRERESMDLLRQIADYLEKGAAADEPRMEPVRSQRERGIILR
jgi:hypothetical protein